MQNPDTDVRTPFVGMLRFVRRATGQMIGDQEVFNQILQQYQFSAGDNGQFWYDVPMVEEADMIIIDEAGEVTPEMYETVNKDAVAGLGPLEGSDEAFADNSGTGMSTVERMKARSESPPDGSDREDGEAEAMTSDRQYL